MSHPPTSERKRRETNVNWAGVIGAAVAGISTLIVGYLIGRETETQLQEHRRRQEQSAYLYTGSISSAATSSTSSAASTKQSTPNDIDEAAANDDEACKVCYVYKAVICMLPCRHCATCAACSREMTRCCICQHPVASSIRIFRS
jgi:hypothetical protein